MKPDLPLRVPPNFRIIAHRGASAYAPENTLAAFLLAERMGATEIELDVQFSRDRQLAIVHDETFDRYGYPGLRSADLTLPELVSLDMGSWFSPPPLSRRAPDFPAHPVHRVWQPPDVSCRA